MSNTGCLGQFYDSYPFLPSQSGSAGADDFYRLSANCSARVCAVTLDLSYGRLATLGTVFRTAETEACQGEEVESRSGSRSRSRPYSHVMCPEEEEEEDAYRLGGILHSHFYTNRVHSGISCAICHRVSLRRCRCCATVAAAAAAVVVIDATVAVYNNGCLL